LGTASIGYDIQNFHTYAMSFTGSTIQVLYDGKVVITATDATYASGMVALDVANQVVTFNRVLVTSNTSTAASLAPSPASLTFSGGYNSTNPSPQTINVSSSGTGAVAWTALSSAPWLTLSVSNGITPASIQASVNTSTLVPGTYTGTIRIASFGVGNSPQSIPVTLTITSAPSALSLSPSAMSFTALLNQANPAAQNLAISNLGFGPLSWSASASFPWLSVTPGSGTAAATASVNVNATGMTLGQYSGSITISSPGIANSPQSIPVTLSVLAQDLGENFADLASGWVVSPMGQASGWTVSNGTYLFNGAGNSQSCAGNTAWSNYTFDTNVRLSNLSNWPGGVRGRVNPNTGAGYLVWLYPANGFTILYKIGQWDVNGPVLTQLAQAPLTFDTTQFHDLQMAFSGTQISVSWDGKQIMSANDSSYTGGYVCMDTSNQPISYQNIRVASSQTAVTLTAAPSALTFTAAPGAAPSSQTVSVTAGNAATTWGVTTSAPWLTATASSSFTPGTLTVTANPTGLAQGTYSGTVTLSAPGATGSPLAISVSFGVQTAILSLSPKTLTFFGSTASNPPTQAIALANTGTGTLHWTATADSAWIGLNPVNGTAPASVVISPNTSGLAIGQHSGNVAIASPDVSTSPVKIPISLQVGTSLFFDNFASGTASNWTISPQGNASGWSVINGTYAYGGQGGTQAYAGSTSWTNYTVSTDFQISSLNDWPGGIRGRLNTSTGASYGVWVYPAQQFLILYRIGAWDINAQLTQLGPSASVNIDTPHKHNLRMSFNGSQIEVYYDNALVMQATDSTYAQGAIALDVADQPISFTNVSVIGF
jgi:Viral BACON domain